MGDVYGVEYTQLYVNAVPTKIDASLFGGRVRAQFLTYEASALTTASVIFMTQLKKGDAVLPMSQLNTDALGTGVTLKVGDYYAESTSTDDDDRYLAAVACSTAGQTKNLDAQAGLGYKLTYDAIIQIINAGSATGTITLSLLYSGA